MERTLIKKLKYANPGLVEWVNRRKHYYGERYMRQVPLASFACVATLQFPDEPTIMDVGANYGQATISMRHFLPRARFVAIEPNPDLAEPLHWMAKRLGNVEVIIAAASDTYGLVTLNVPVLGAIRATGGASLSRAFVEERMAPELTQRYGAPIHFEVRRVPSVPLDASSLHSPSVRI